LIPTFANKERRLRIFSRLFTYGKLLRCEGVAVASHVVVSGKDMGLLFCQKLTDGKRKILIQRVFISIFGFVFALFGGLEKCVISARP
jgi:hypothetical protein